MGFPFQFLEGNSQFFLTNGAGWGSIESPWSHAHNDDDDDDRWIFVHNCECVWEWLQLLLSSFPLGRMKICVRVVTYLLLLWRLSSFVQLHCILFIDHSVTNQVVVVRKFIWMTGRICLFECMLRTEFEFRDDRRSVVPHFVRIIHRLIGTVCQRTSWSSVVVRWSFNTSLNIHFIYFIIPY